MKRNKYYWRISLVLIGLLYLILSLYITKLNFIDLYTQIATLGFADTIYYMPLLKLTKLGSGTFIMSFTLVIIGVLLILYKNLYQPALFGFSVLASWSLNHLIKQLIRRERPSIVAELDAVGFSFPSGHAMISFVCYSLACYFIVQKLKNKIGQYIIKSSFISLIILIGLSRYLLNVHYATDVLAGYGFGYLLYLSIIWIDKRFYTLDRHKAL